MSWGAVSINVWFLMMAWDSAVRSGAFSKDVRADELRMDWW